MSTYHIAIYRLCIQFQTYLLKYFISSRRATFFLLLWLVKIIGYWNKNLSRYFDGWYTNPCEHVTDHETLMSVLSSLNKQPQFLTAECSLLVNFLQHYFRVISEAARFNAESIIWSIYKYYCYTLVSKKGNKREFIWIIYQMIF